MIVRVPSVKRPCRGKLGGGVVRQWFAVVLLVLVAVVLLRSTTAFAEVDETTVTLSELNYPDATLTTEEPLVEYWFELPENWVLENTSELELVLSYPAGDGGARPGRIEISVNDKVVDQLPLDKTGQDLLRQQVALPFGLPTPAGLHVKVEYDSRGGDEGCDEPDDRFVTVHGISLFRLSHRSKQARGDLAILPYPFSYKRARSPVVNYFALPQQPSEAALDAAVGLARWFGGAADKSAFRFEV